MVEGNEVAEAAITRGTTTVRASLEESRKEDNMLTCRLMRKTHKKQIYFAETESVPVLRSVEVYREGRKEKGAVISTDRNVRKGSGAIAEWDRDWILTEKRREVQRQKNINEERDEELRIHFNEHEKKQNFVQVLEQKHKSAPGLEKFPRRSKSA